MNWFMDISEILAMPANDSAGMTVGETLDYNDTSVDNPYHQAIKQEMTLAGHNIVPVYIDEYKSRWWFYNGLHRVKLAVELGHSEMLVTDNPYEHRPDDAWEHTVVLFTGREQVFPEVTAHDTLDLGRECQHA